MPSFSLSQRFSLLLLPVLAFGLILVGCGGNGGANDDEEGVPYQVGESLSDSTLALVVSSEYGTDTLTTQRYRRQMQMAMKRQSPQQRSDDEMQELRRQLVRGFSRQHVLRGEALNRGIEADTARVTKRLEQWKQGFNSEEQRRQWMAKNNLTADSIRALLASQLQQQALQRQMSQEYEKPSEEEVESYSKENRRIRAQHILLKVGEDAPQSRVDSSRQAAAALIDSARMESADFAELARRHSDGPTARKGGDLGFFSRDRMVEPFSEAAFALSDSGDVAPEPVRTQFGFHVIRLTSPGKPMDTTKARQQMMQERQKEAVENQINELLKKVTVRSNPDVVEAGLYEE